MGVGLVLWLVGLGAGVASSGDATTVPSANALGSSCADYIVIDSRGSGEQTSLSAPGGVFYGFFRAAVRRRDPTARLAVISNGYPAWGSIPTLVSALLKLPQRYHQSVVEGKNMLSALINARLSNCPDSKLILTGYSQGAQVTGDVYQNNSSRRIIGVVLFGDPKFNSADPAARGGKAGLDGALGTRPLFRVAPGSWSTGHVLSFCHDKDPVCQGVSRLRFGPRFHSYSDTDEPQLAAEYVARFVRMNAPREPLLPTVRCPVTTPLDGSDFPTWPDRQPARVPQALVARLAVYVGGYQRVVALRGSRCKAGVGQNGTSWIQARIPGLGDTAYVDAGTIPACVGCVYTAACAYFPEANKLATPIDTCPGRKPGERVTRLSSALVRVDGPAGLVSLLYFRAKPIHSFASVSCYPNGAVCDAVLADWRSHKRI